LARRAFTRKGSASQADAARAAELRQKVLPTMPVGVRNDFAWELAVSPAAELRDGAFAVEIMERATAERPTPAYIDTLAAAYAEAGRFDDAMRAQQRAIDALPRDASAESRDVVPRAPRSLPLGVSLPRGAMTRVLAALLILVPWRRCGADARPGAVRSGRRRARSDRGNRQQHRGDLQARRWARYDAEIAAQPHRILAQIARCEFVESFPNEYEYVTFSDETYELAEQCEGDLAAALPGASRVQLWQLGRMYDAEEALSEGQRLLARANVFGWTGGQRARLYVELAATSERPRHGGEVSRTHCGLRAAPR
jgi:tetratricopeptide (TPR) repeat protein